MSQFLYLWFVWLGLAAIPPTQVQDDALLPSNGFLQVWKKSEPARTFASRNLYGYIDGGAEVFLEFGFEQLLVQPYTGGSKDGGEIQVELYRMTDFGAATGIYLMNCGRESPDPSLRLRHTINQYQLIFKRDRYYGVINNPDGAAQLRPAMLEFARFIAARLPAENPVPAGQELPPKGLTKGSVRLIRGPFTLQSVFSLGPGDILQLGRKITAVSGDYQDATGGYTLIIANYPDEAAARRAFAQVSSNLDSYLKVQEKSERRLVFKDFNNEFGVVSVTGKQLSAKVHLKKVTP
jgi:hypothetical protein